MLAIKQRRVPPDPRPESKSIFQIEIVPAGGTSAANC